ncbi:MAG: ATP-binding protein [Dysgonomonas sp.]|nr:ATP-binding protein [Dysgonomonas sp.]
MEKGDKDEIKKEKLPRVYSMKDLMNIVYQVFEFTGIWFKILGCPEKGATWFIWGGSGNGKSTACAILAYLLSSFGKVLYIALEEQKGKSIRSKLLKAGFKKDSKNFQLLPKESYDQLIQRLHKRNSPDIIFIDSLQYWGISYKQYQKLKELFPDKTFVFVSHAKGKEPKGGVADSIHYDAAIKIFVEGGRITVKHRFEGGGGEMDVIPELAEKYWNSSGGPDYKLLFELLLRFVRDNKMQPYLSAFIEKEGYNINELRVEL